MAKRRGEADQSACQRGSIIVISAPSGAGKSTLIERVLRALPSLSFSVSHTTRRPRAGERQGREYFFVSRPRFRRMAAAGDFLEWAEVYSNYYGTSRRQVDAAVSSGRDILLDIDVQGHGQVRRKLPEAISVFVLPPSFKELEHRLRRRHSDAPEVIAERLGAARREVRRWKEYDYVVVNDSLSRATRALKSIIEAARQRRQTQKDCVGQIRKTFGGW